ncbi:hypothetical protein NEUTE2DRAFT_48669, partial [Neurospora tetrasperma FGSC 2509]
SRSFTRLLFVSPGYKGVYAGKTPLFFERFFAFFNLLHFPSRPETKNTDIRCHSPLAFKTFLIFPNIPFFFPHTYYP